ncbi:MAG: CpaF family protein [Clostridiales bacterium]|jgi:pilus assembly protein CpaF|nr:CpaF family protein [Eubacteriales bacterium]MDH7566299.1 CpaF family protein [Clostridiales bacterium]
MNNSRFYKDLREYIGSNIDNTRDYEDEEILSLIEECVFEKSRDMYLSISQKRELVAAIFNSMRRLDVLQPLIDDDGITEIMINGTDMVFTEREGIIRREELRFESQEKLYNIIQSIVSKVNRSVNESSPIVDARLQDGSRVHVVLPPIALNGPVVTIRKFPEKPLTMEHLIRMGSITREAAEFLEKLVRAKYNIFISGGTGSGKTTFLNVLSGFIPQQERVITIEDSAELQVQSIPNIVRLETRNANTEGKGEITVRDLIKASLRMRPDRIIVGEVRGAEALDMLQAMNTGHDGSLSTGHANSTADMLSRLETMVLCGAVLPIEAIRQQIASALDIVIHLGRMRDMTRKVLEITELVGYREHCFQLNPLYVFDEDGTRKTDVDQPLRRTGNALVNTHKLKMAGISL